MRKIISMLALLALAAIAGCGGRNYDPAVTEGPGQNIPEAHSPYNNQTINYIMVTPGNRSTPPTPLHIGDNHHGLILHEISTITCDAGYQSITASFFNNESSAWGSLHIVRDADTGYQSTVFHVTEPTLEWLPMWAGYQYDLTLNITNPDILDEYLLFMTDVIGNLDIWINDTTMVIGNYAISYSNGMAFHTAEIAHLGPHSLSMHRNLDMPFYLDYFFADTAGLPDEFIEHYIDTKEFLDTFEHTHIFNFGADTMFSRTFFLWADMPLLGFQLISVNNNYTLTGSFYHYAGQVLFAVDELLPGEALIIEDFHEHNLVPTIGVSFLDENNKRRHFFINQDTSGLFPPYTSREFVDRTAGPPIGITAGIDPSPTQRAAITRILGEFELGEIQSKTIDGDELFFRIVYYDNRPTDDVIRILSALGYVGWALYQTPFEAGIGHAVLIYTPRFHETQLLICDDTSWEDSTSFWSISLDWAYDFRRQER